MAKSSEIIVMEMLDLIHREGGHPKTWFVGITDIHEEGCLTNVRCIIRTMLGFIGRLPPK